MFKVGEIVQVVRIPGVELQSGPHTARIESADAYGMFYARVQEEHKTRRGTWRAGEGWGFYAADLRRLYGPKGYRVDAGPKTL